MNGALQIKLNIFLYICLIGRLVGLLKAEHINDNLCLVILVFLVGIVFVVVISS